MVISGLIIETIQGTAHSAAVALEGKTGVEVHHIDGGNKVIITIETETADESYRISESFKEIEGVLTVCLAYSHFEDDPFCQRADDVI